MKYRSCPLCGSTDSTTVFSFDIELFDDSPISGCFTLEECNHCGFHSYDTPSGIEEWSSFYASHYLIRYYQERESSLIQQELLNKTVDTFKRAQLSKSAYIVDVGCGPGHLLTTLRARGYTNIAGVEVCTEFLPELQNRNIPSFEGIAEKLPFADNSVDALAYGHILEHLLNPSEAIIEMRRCLKPNGVTLVELPDLASYDRVENVAPINQFILEHINHFNLQNLSALFQKYGFEMIVFNKDIKDQMPIMRVLYRKVHSLCRSKIIKPDFSFGSKVRKWCSGSATYASNIKDQLLHEKQNVHIWGISYQTLSRLSLIGFNQLNISGLYDIDPRKQVKTIHGRLIKSPEFLKGVSTDDAVIIGVGPSSGKMHKIIQDYGFKGNIIHL